MPVEIGVVVPMYQLGAARRTPRWPEMLLIAKRADELGFDTIWTIDELLWLPEGKAPMGVWEGVAVAGALAAVTSRAKVGTWVLSALHRNPGIIAKTAETLDEISGGRFVFGLGAGHTGPGQAHAFGLPEDKVFARFDDALAIIVPLLRAGRADYEGTYYSAHDLAQIPQGPRPGAIPLFIGGNGPRIQRAAVRHADIWSSYIEQTLDEAAPRIKSFEQICAEEGRDPSSIGRSVGFEVNPMTPKDARPSVVSGSVDEMAAVLRSLADAGYTQIEMQLEPGTLESLEAIAPLVGLMHEYQPAAR